VELDNDPDLQASFSVALAALFLAFKDNWDKFMKNLKSCVIVLLVQVKSNLWTS
jgi:hypothetical protein